MADQLITGTTLVEKESRSVGDAPIGSILAWAKTLAGVPNLAEGWVECDGSVLVDALSPLNGQTIPDLNGGIFLEGQATSGATGGNASSAHTHGVDISVVGGELAFGGNTGAGSGQFTTARDTAGSGAFESDENRITTGGASATENRPPFYTVVWIMRIR